MSYQQLEETFGEFVGNENMVVCSSGTAALHLAFEVMREVYSYDKTPIAVPETTMIACPRAIKLADLTPVPCSVNDLGLLYPPGLDTELVGGVLTVHLYGRRGPTNFSDIPVVEDLAEAHGIMPEKTSFAACWSFYKNKIIAGEEGGAVCFQTEDQAQLARKLRCLGMEDNYKHLPRGMNYRLSDANAALILDSLKKFDINLLRRKRVEVMYNEVIPKEWQLPSREVPWVYDLNLPYGVDSFQVVRNLQDRGVPARVAFQPISDQEEFQQDFACEIARDIASRRIYLPITPDMKPGTVGLISKALIDLVI